MTSNYTEIDPENNNAENALKKSREVYNEKMDSLGRFAGGIAHDFNNVLSSIIGYLSLAMEEAGELHGNKKVLELIEKSTNVAKNALDMNDQLLLFAQKGVMNRSPIDIHRVIEDSILMLEPIKGKGIEVKSLYKATNDKIIGDVYQVENAIFNLMLNSTDAINEDGEITTETKSVEVTAKFLVDNPHLYSMNPGEYLLLQARDTGIGMDEKSIQKIFEPFHSSKESKKTRGLGLANVYSCLKNHGGHIWVKSKPGEGTAISLYFPSL